ncbi:MAG: hypothetical protein KAU31_02610 [Spirochaetaceae bacterium]|nr:hypothetical protein [Spirochaetaceae bacterium]
MKRGTRLVLLSVVVGVSLLLAGCFARSMNPAVVFNVVVDVTTYEYDATLDFGLVNPEGDPSVVAAELLNITDGDITVTGVSTDNALFSVETEALPFTVSAGESTSASLTFDPTASGAVTAVLSAVIDGADLPFVLNLSGEGNYPPVVEAIVEVSGAGTAAANGTYYRTGEVGQGYPVYRLGTDYVLYGWDNDGIEWLIDDDLDSGSYLYSLHTGGCYTAPNGTPSDWFTGVGDTPDPTTVGEIKSSLGSLYWLPQDDVISPNYLYSDVEEDTEGATLYQWYRLDTPTGTYLPIPGETDSSYTVVIGDDGYYLKVLVTPVATDGFTTGEPVWFGPSPPVSVIS